MPVALLILAAFAVPGCESSLQPITEALQSNNVTQASSLLQAVPAECSYSSDFYALSAITSELSGNNSAAEGFFLKAISIEPKSAKLHEQLGAAYLRNGNPAAAAVQLREALVLDPNNETAKKYLIGAYVGSQAWSSAADLFDRIGGRSAVGYEPVMLVWFAQTLLETKQFDRLNRELSPRDPKLLPSALFSIGSVCAKSSRYESALAYWQAIPMEAIDDAVFFNLGLAYSHLSRFADARKNYFLAIDKHPDHVDAYFRVGLDFVSEATATKALPWLSRAYQLAPERNDIACAFAEQLIQLGYIDTAGKILDEAAVKSGASDDGIEVAKADLKQATADLDGAAVNYRALLEKRPAFVPALLGLAKVSSLKGNDEEARAALLAAYAADPGNPEASGRLGLLEMRDEHWDSAAQYLKLAWAKQKSQPDVALALSRIYRHSNQPLEALQLLQACRAAVQQSAAYHLELAKVYTQLHRSSDAEAERKRVSELQSQAVGSLRFDPPKTYVQ